MRLKLHDVSPRSGGCLNQLHCRIEIPVMGLGDFGNY
jgi:hypothetical protein